MNIDKAVAMLTGDMVLDSESCVAIAALLQTQDATIRTMRAAAPKHVISAPHDFTKGMSQADLTRQLNAFLDGLPLHELCFVRIGILRDLADRIAKTEVQHVHSFDVENVVALVKAVNKAIDPT